MNYYRLPGWCGKILLTNAMALCPCCAIKSTKQEQGWYFCAYCGHRWRQSNFENLQSYYQQLRLRNNLKADVFEKKLQSRFEVIAEILKTHQYRSVMEVGCAEGALGKWVKEYFDSITYDGIELSQDALVAQEYLDQVFEQPVSELSLTRYDLIVSFHVLEHIENVEKELDGWRKALSNEGKLLIEVPNKAGHPFLEYDHNPEHLHQFTVQSLTLLLARAGFEIQSVHTSVFESPVYSDSIRIQAFHAVDENSRRKNFLSKIKSLLPNPFVIYGVGGDFINYVAPVLNDLPIRALADSNPALHGKIVEGHQVEAYDAQKFSGVPVLICSLRFQDEIRAQLIKQGLADDCLQTLTSIFE